MLHFANCPHGRLHRLVVVVSLLFGVLTLFAGGRTLAGWSDPGHPIVQPVLVFNTVMGLAYVVVAILLRNSLERGRIGAAVIAAANLVVLSALWFHASRGGVVAVDTMRAMLLRTGVWFGIWVAATWMLRRPRATA